MTYPLPRPGQRAGRQQRRPRPDHGAQDGPTRASSPVR